MIGFLLYILLQVAIFCIWQVKIWHILSNNSLTYLTLFPHMPNFEKEMSIWNSLHSSLVFKLFYETVCKICQNWGFVTWEWSLSVVGLRSSTHLTITRSSSVTPDWCQSIAWLSICCIFWKGTEDVTKMSLIIVVWYDSGKNKSTAKRKKVHKKMMQIQYQYWRAIKSH